MPPRNRPFGAFRFLVEIEQGFASDDFKACFQEVGPFAIEAPASEYRNGNHKSNAPMKLTGIYKVPDVTFKRGVIGDLSLYQWLDQVRKGSQGALRTVRVHLLPETGDPQPVQTWILKNARITKYTGPTLNGKAAEVAIDEIVMTAEDLEIEG